MKHNPQNTHDAGGPWLGEIREYLLCELNDPGIIFNSKHRVTLSIGQIEHLAAIAVATDRNKRDEQYAALIAAAQKFLTHCDRDEIYSFYTRSRFADALRDLNIKIMPQKIHYDCSIVKIGDGSHCQLFINGHCVATHHAAFFRKRGLIED